MSSSISKHRIHAVSTLLALLKEMAVCTEEAHKSKSRSVGLVVSVGPLLGVLIPRMLDSESSVRSLAIDGLNAVVDLLPDLADKAQNDGADDGSEKQSPLRVDAQCRRVIMSDSLNERFIAIRDICTAHLEWHEKFVEYVHKGTHVQAEGSLNATITELAARLISSLTDSDLHARCGAADALALVRNFASYILICENVLTILNSYIYHTRYFD